MCPRDPDRARRIARLAVILFALSRSGGSWPALAHGQQAPRVDQLRFSPPVTLATLDMEELHGEPSRLSWSGDGTTLYLQTLQGGFGTPNPTLRHYVLDATNGSTREVESEPAWASAYWGAKSGKTSPDDPPMKIDLKTERRQERTTSLPQGGDLARGGASPGITENDQVSILARQSVPEITLLLRGETIGKFVNTVLVPGLTYGWGPMGARVIAFAAQDTGRVIVMDDEGRKQEVAGSKDAILPAWSPDGDRIVWLQKDGRRTFQLRVTHVSVA
ncbi:MAG TPA: hypothetical protein VK886_03835 [Vicinamibacterales bacterium]|nr:hypothetical protein [Vicinamibacterales bacterium]